MPPAPPVSRKVTRERAIGITKMRWFWSRERREAASRAPEFADYYLRMYGDQAGEVLRRKIERSKTRYYRRLYTLALSELRKRR